MMLDTTMCSSILETTDVKDTGRWLAGFERSAFLKIGTTLAVFQSAGTTPVFKESWKIH